MSLACLRTGAEPAGRRHCATHILLDWLSEFRSRSENSSRIQHWSAEPATGSSKLVILANTVPIHFLTEPANVMDFTLHDVWVPPGRHARRPCPIILEIRIDPWMLVYMVTTVIIEQSCRTALSASSFNFSKSAAKAHRLPALPIGHPSDPSTRASFWPISKDRLHPRVTPGFDS